MTIQRVYAIHRWFGQWYPDLPEVTLKDDFATGSRKLNSVDQLISSLTETGRDRHLVYLRKEVSAEEWPSFFEELTYPVLYVGSQNEELVTVLIWKDKQEKKGLVFDADGKPSSFDLKGLDQLKDELGDQAILVCLPAQSVYTEPENGEPVQKLTPFKRLLRLLSFDKKEIGYVYLYAVIAGIISLSLPLGIQSIFGFVSSGQVTTSVVVLVTFVLLGVLVSGGLQVMQLWIVEHIQQRIFARTAFDFAFRVPRIKPKALQSHDPSELMNRFFDTLTLQKGMAKILVDLPTAMIQMIFGLLLLSLYHPYFIFLGLLLMAIIGIVLRFTGRKGLETSLKESKYKYKLVAWLEQVASTINTFKLAGVSNLALDKTDGFVDSYLKARKKHFKVLMGQYWSMVTFKILITATMLVLGTVLVIDQEINIGQFVASEIVIILILNSVEKIVVKLDAVYDVLTGVEKIGQVTDLPLEQNGNMQIVDTKDQGPIEVKLENVGYTVPGHECTVLQQMDLHLEPGSRVCVTGAANSGKTVLGKVVTGLLAPERGRLTYNGVSINTLSRNGLQAQIAACFSPNQLFDGTIWENLTLGNPAIEVKDALDVLKLLELDGFVNTLADGLNSRLVGGALRLSQSVAYRLVLARCILSKPSLMVVDEMFAHMHIKNWEQVWERLESKKTELTLMLISNDPSVMERCDKVVLMRGGKAVATGSYEQLKDHHELQNIINKG